MIEGEMTTKSNCLMRFSLSSCTKKHLPIFLLLNTDILSSYKKTFALNLSNNLLAHSPEEDIP